MPAIATSENAADFQEGRFRAAAVKISAEQFRQMVLFWIRKTDLVRLNGKQSSLNVINYMRSAFHSHDYIAAVEATCQS